MQPSPNEKQSAVFDWIALTISYPYISRCDRSRNTTSSGTPFRKLGFVRFTTNVNTFLFKVCQHQTDRYRQRFILKGKTGSFPASSACNMGLACRLGFWLVSPIDHETLLFTPR